MVEQENFGLDKKREKLLRERLGAHLDWVKPEIFRTIGPFEPEIFDNYDQERRALITDWSAWLEQRSDDEIAVLMGEEPEGGVEIDVSWPEDFNMRLRYLRKDPPLWYAGGFGHPDHQADFDYWSKMAKFTRHEILCLSVGADPESISENKIEQLKQKDTGNYFASLQFLLRRDEQLKRQFRLSRSGIFPKEFLTWVSRVSFEAHGEFIEKLRDAHWPKPRSTNETDAAKEPDKREIDKVAQLFTAMAIEHLGYDPKAAKSPIPKEINDLAASMGLEISDDTIRKYLKLGANFIPADWEPE